MRYIMSAVLCITATIVGCDTNIHQLMQAHDVEEIEVSRAYPTDRMMVQVYHVVPEGTVPTGIQEVL